MLSYAQKLIFLPAVLIMGLNFALTHPAEASSRLDPENHPFSWAQGLGTSQEGMAGGQKWGTRQDQLTGRAWCTTALDSATVNPRKVQKPIPWVPGCQPHPAAWEAQQDAGRTGGGGHGVGVPAHLPTSKEVPTGTCSAAAGEGRLKQLTPWDKSGLET